MIATRINPTTPHLCTTRTRTAAAAESRAEVKAGEHNEVECFVPIDKGEFIHILPIGAMHKLRSNATTHISADNSAEAPQTVEFL